MPQLDGFDYSFTRPDPVKMHQAGLLIVGRYLYDGGKGLTAAEATGLHGVGLGIGPLYYEAHAGYLLDPSSARGYGLDGAQHAAALGIPGSVPICHSLDVDTGPSQFGTVAKSMAAINAVRGRAEGFYGEADAIDYLWDRGLISYAVNTAAVGWSGGRVSPHAAIWQYQNGVSWNGAAVDYLTIVNRAAVEAATWWPAGHQAPSSSGDPDMDATDKKMLAFVYQQIRGAVGPGQRDFKGSIAALLDTEQVDVNLDRSAASQLAAIRTELQKLEAAK